MSYRRTSTTTTSVKLAKQVEALRSDVLDLIAKENKNTNYVTSLLLIILANSFLIISCVFGKH